jgi:beta-aspartyl-dipeptidase (metallo-type)
MLSGKSGVVSIHTGDDDTMLSLLKEAVSQSAIPPSQFYPTHINRNQALLDDGIAWAKMGGIIDMTTSTNEVFVEEGEILAADAIAYCLKKGVPASQLTMSSDGHASLPVFDKEGNLAGLEVGRIASLHESLQSLATRQDINLTDAIATVTSSPANVLGLKQKGYLTAGADADVVLLESDSFNIHSVFAMGKPMIEKGEVLIKGTFE